MVNIYLVKPNGLVVLSCDNMVSQLQKNFESDHSDYLFLEFKVWHVQRFVCCVLYIHVDKVKLSSS